MSLARCLAIKVTAVGSRAALLETVLGQLRMCGSPLAALRLLMPEWTKAMQGLKWGGKPVSESLFFVQDPAPVLMLSRRSLSTVSFLSLNYAPEVEVRRPVAQPVPRIPIGVSDRDVKKAREVPSSPPRQPVRRPRARRSEEVSFLDDTGTRAALEALSEEGINRNISRNVVSGSSVEVLARKYPVHLPQFIEYVLQESNGNVALAGKILSVAKPGAAKVEKICKK
jgi:hypothetical protein